MTLPSDSAGNGLKKERSIFLLWKLGLNWMKKESRLASLIKESKESHQLIEEFMLLANRTVATHVAKIKIKKKPVPFPYRIHDTPDKEKLAPFVLFAKKYGHNSIPKHRKALQLPLT